MTLLVRSASLTNYAAVARSAGLDPVRMVKAVGIDPVCLEQPDFKIPAAAVGRLFDNSARRSGWTDFGLRLAESRPFSVTGPLALLAREQATLRAAIGVHTRYIHLHNESLHIWLEDDPLTASIRFEYEERDVPTVQSMELSIAMVHRWLRQCLPEGWTSRLVCFMHAAPADVRTAIRLFSKVEYSAAFNAIVCAKKDLDRPLPSYAQLERYAQQYVESITARSDRSTTEKVRQLILTLLPLGPPTITQVARHLALGERTVRRRLESEGTGFNEVLNQMRRDLVQRYLASGSRKHAEVALLLGFSSAIVFASWFRTQYGCSASEWVKREHLSGTPMAMKGRKR